ncbi:MAG: molybdopterin-binding protein [Desulfovibrionaceae bacterium]|nr:molybdopterin-binding protein [Solidesulfovibrio magneticus]
MRVIAVEEAVGTVLCHDITRIVPGESKGPAFRKGHVVRPEDVSELLRLGKEHLYVWDIGAGLVHEDDAAARIAKAVAGEGVTLSAPCEGRINLLAARRGLGVVTTGGEVYHGRIKDKFGPVLRRKFAELGCTVVRQVIVPDDRDMTERAIRRLAAEGVELVAVTGGMSVDPDDLSPSSIRAAGGRLVAYGAPIFPGAMFLLAYRDDVPVIGLPGCVMYHRTSVFDLLVPRLVTGERLSREDIVELGHGGLCAMCPECRYPACGFGKS